MWKPKCIGVACIVAMTTLNVLASSMEGPHPTLFVSPSGKLGLKVLPQRKETDWDPRAKAVLFSLNTDGSEKALWEASLVNIPRIVLISPTGKRVVTLDTYGNTGADHVLVIYNEQGVPLCDYKLEELLTKAEIEKNVPANRWGDKIWVPADVPLTIDDSGILSMTLSGGTILKINLDDGKLVR